jgi:uncharacterized protein (TIGR03435 family)
VASVKPNKSGDIRQSGVGVEGERVTVVNLLLRQLIQATYNLSSERVIGPEWIGGERYDISAKASSPLIGNEWRPMMEALLNERFHLAVHRETRQLNLLALVMARGDRRLGPNLHAAETDCATLRAQGGSDDPCGQRSLGSAPMTGKVRVRGMGLDTLLGTIARESRSQVVDHTELSGNFDWDLVWTPQGSLRAAPNADGTSLYTALQEQLGLKVESIKGPVEVLVIDRVDRPTPD